jgi:hypothetical protein
VRQDAAGIAAYGPHGQGAGVGRRALRLEWTRLDGLGLAIHLIGAVWLIAAIEHHDAGGVWSPSFGAIVSGAIVAWIGFLLLLVGLAAYGVELVRDGQGQARSSSARKY